MLSGQIFSTALQKRVRPFLEVAGRHMAVSQLIVLAGMICIGFAAWAISDLAGLWLPFALLPAALMLHLQLSIGFLAKSAKPLLAGLGLLLYLLFSGVNTLLGGGGATAVFSSSALGSKKFEAAVAPAVEQIQAVASSASTRAARLTSLSAYSTTVAQTEASTGRTCDPSVGPGEGDYHQTRMDMGRRMASLANDAKADAAALVSARLEVAKSISTYSVDNHDQVGLAVAKALSSAQTIGQKIEDPSLRVELAKRLTEAKGAPFVGPKTGRTVICPDHRLAEELESVLKLPVPEIPDAKLPGPPDHRAAVVAFSGAVFDGLFGGEPFDWAIFVLIGKLNDEIRKSSIAESIAEQIGHSVDEPGYNWSCVRETLGRVVCDDMLADLRALKVVIPGWLFADRHYIAIPVAAEFERELHLAQMLVVAGEATARSQHFPGGATAKP